MIELQRKRPNYDPNALREGTIQLDVNIDRLQRAIDGLRQGNDQLKQSIIKNNMDIQVFTVEIGKLEHQKVELSRLITEIERERK